jgi:hypothetical protein
MSRGASPQHGSQVLKTSKPVLAREAPYRVLLDAEDPGGLERAIEPGLEFRIPHDARASRVPRSSVLHSGRQFLR